MYVYGEFLFVYILNNRKVLYLEKNLSQLSVEIKAVKCIFNIQRRLKSVRISKNIMFFEILGLISINDFDYFNR